MLVIGSAWWADRVDTCDDHAAEDGRQNGSVERVSAGTSAHADLQYNLKRAKVEARTSCARTEEWLERRGLGKAMVRDLLRLKAPQVTIVSCNPSTLARDLAELKAAYDIAGLTLVDLFPQTYHLETIVKLRLR